MTAQEIRKAYLKFFEERGHKVIPRALLVPQNDPTTLFTGSGMQPLIPNLLGEPHPEGSRLTNSQTCLRAQDIEEVGDNRHTTFFEMLGNWSLGDYFKAEQLPWFFEFLVGQVGLEPERLYVSCFIGDETNSIPKDVESAEIWKRLFDEQGIKAKEVEIGSEANGYQVGMPESGRIFYYDASKNWWCRAGTIGEMPVGEPGGPDSEVFYDFGTPHDEKYGKNCHPNCECGRFLEIGNSVFMEYVKTEAGFAKLPKQNVDFGGGLERIAAAGLQDPDVFKISLLKPIIDKLEQISGKEYDSHTESMRVIADHLRAAAFLAIDGVVPSNKEQGYVMRRLMRRAIRFAFDLGIEQNFLEQIVPVIVDLYQDDFPEVTQKRDQVIEVLIREEKAFRQTLRKGLKEFDSIAGMKMSGEYNTGSKPPELRAVIFGTELFKLYDTYGFPVELSIEEAFKRGIDLESNWQDKFDYEMDMQRERSRTATKGEFKGGLADHSEITTKYHTATHLMYKALRIVLGDHVIQRGSNITAERLRFDFSHPDKMTPEQIAEVEKIVNEQIDKDWPVSWREENTKEALANGVMGAFGDRYGETVKIYTVGEPDGENFSREICGGPHVEHTGQLGEGGMDSTGSPSKKRFKITKEESSSAGVRRIKAVLD
ncbi:MAG TPA: alanine--tRNA ligase [Candidatus Saccharimonadales bacterium]|nr:alanine--tRNA ligase [Candidatus Saccharimonadales bacterium]